MARTHHVSEVAASVMNKAEDPVPVSFMVATHNRPESLARTVEAIANQQGVDIELVVIDDCSAAEVVSVLTPFEERMKIRLIRLSERQGCAGARAIGIEQCSNEVVIQLDDDSHLVENDAASRLARHLLADPQLGALTLRIHQHWSGDRDGVGEIYQRWRGAHGSEEFTFQGCGVVLRRSAAISAGNYPREFEYGGQEDYLAARLIALGKRIELFAERCRVVHGDENLSPREPGRLRGAEKRTFHAAHLVLTAWLLFPIPLNLVISVFRFLLLTLRGTGHPGRVVTRVRLLAGRLERKPFSWGRAVRYLALRHRVRLQLRRKN